MRQGIQEAGCSQAAPRVSLSESGTGRAIWFCVSHLPEGLQVSGLSQGTHGEYQEN
ncbi:hypothetical protein E2C01_077428 [Portunus trituberculatus]|uniref:Uncharacterized protein n=1 Tax=Portunus trituberculatus TaxID=210409 RepID=A0A5B7IM91_PORTR|nr:hypothetical protein [Portunus trituberculatus]